MGVDDAPKADVIVVAPKACVFDVPKTGWLCAPNVVEPKVVVPRQGRLCWKMLPNGLD